MDVKQLQRLRGDLAAFLDAVLPDLGRKGRRAWAELYVRGLLLEGRRKSVEPMAARLKEVDRGGLDYEQGLQQFVNQSPWDERPVRDRLARHLKEALDPDGLLILDDIGFPKQGTHSAGVGRQYSGTLGKVGEIWASSLACSNSGVSWSVLRNDNSFHGLRSSRITFGTVRAIGDMLLFHPRRQFPVRPPGPTLFPALSRFRSATGSRPRAPPAGTLAPSRRSRPPPGLGGRR
jgi:hypothetical protein